MNSTTYSPLTLRVPFSQRKAYANTFLEVPAMFTAQDLPWGVHGYLINFVENY
jgi:hypothetical protein